MSFIASNILFTDALSFCWSVQRWFFSKKIYAAGYFGAGRADTGPDPAGSGANRAAVTVLPLHPDLTAGRNMRPGGRYKLQAAADPESANHPTHSLLPD